MPRLTLKAVDFRDPQHWRWTLTDHNGVYLGDHEVRLDSRSPDYLALLDLYGHLERYCLPDRRQEETRILDQLGAWAGPLALHDVSLIFRVEGDARRHGLHPVGRRLRVLAVFSLPEGQSALDLRRERYQLSRLFNGLAGQRGLAIDVRVLQYGVTRRTLQRVLEEGEGWDLIHFSGHGGAAVLILETAARMPDPLPSADLVALLKPARARLKWVTLSACSSAAATIEETLRWLDLKPRRDAPPAAASTDRRELTALARALQAGAAFQTALDEKCGDFWYAMAYAARQGEEQGAIVVRAGLSGAPYLMRLGRWDDASTLLEQVRLRDEAPSTLAAILPLLRRIAEATAGTREGLENAGVLASALSDAGRIDEAEAMLRETIRASVKLKEFRIASGVVGHLINILRQTGRAPDALALVDKKRNTRAAPGSVPGLSSGTKAAACRFCPGSAGIRKSSNWSKNYAKPCGIWSPGRARNAKR